MKDFKELKVWTKAHEMTMNVYEETRCFPKEELYGLTSQLRRAAASIGANSAEGCGRRSDGEFTRFLQIARGSATELEYHLLLARDLRLLAEDGFRKPGRTSGRGAAHVDFSCPTPPACDSLQAALIKIERGC